jgi:arylsulfatase A-like enzyme
VVTAPRGVCGSRLHPQRPGKYVEDRVPAWDAYTSKEHRHGFNFWYSYGTFDEHKNPHYWDTDGNKHEPHEWSPLHEASVAAAYIRNDGGIRHGDRPFFMMVGMNPPHSPYRSLDDCMEQDYALYKDKPLDSLLVRPNVNRELHKAPSVRYYFASVTGVDRAFGEILAAVHDAGLDSNTVVIFSSDHGETMCSHNTEDPKNSPYSESMNVPFIVRYPGKLTPRVDNLMLSSPDIMPTILGLAGLNDSIPAEVQGNDYSALFFNDKVRMRRPDAALYIQNIDGDKDADGKVISYFPSARGIKTARYTMAIYITLRHQIKNILLFDDQQDPYQMHCLNVDDHPKVMRDLCHRMGEMLKHIDDPWYKDRIMENLIKY